MLVGVLKLIKVHVTNLCRGETTYQRYHAPAGHKFGFVRVQHYNRQYKKVNTHVADMDGMHDSGAQTISHESRAAQETCR